MPTVELVGAIDRAARMLGIEIPNQSHADKVMATLGKLHQTFPRNDVIYGIIAREEPSVIGAGISSVKELGLNKNDYWSAMLLWIPDGGSSSGEQLAPHTLSLIASNPSGDPGFFPEDVAIREVQLYEIDQMAREFPFDNIKFSERNWQISPTARIIIAETVLPELSRV